MESVILTAVAGLLTVLATRNSPGAGPVGPHVKDWRFRGTTRVAAGAIAALGIGTACNDGKQAEPDTASATADPAEIEELERLAVLGYVSGSVPATSDSGVTLHDRERASQGLNLVLSAHAPGATLIDMDGNVLHEWQASFRQVWPRRKVLKRFRNANWFRRAHLFPNGDLIGIWAHSAGILKLDRDSNILWSSTVPAHHDLEVMPDGYIYVLTVKNHIIPRVLPRKPLREDFITVLDPDGRVKRSTSLLEAFENSKAYRFLWMLHPQKTGIAFHANTISVLDGGLVEQMPEFGRGRVLTSMRAMDTIAVIDLDGPEVVWAYKGGFVEQHDPQILTDGSLLLFDNKDGFERSSVEAYDPSNMSLRWAYRGTPEHPFYSEHSGVAQRLANGNTLITESANGRAFEVTAEGAIVWEYYNPNKAGQDDELRATLHEVQRLPPDFDLSWLTTGAK